MANQGIPLIGPVLNKLIGTRNERFVKKYTNRVNAINAMEPEIRKLTDAQLKGKLAEFRERTKGGAKEDDIIVEVFAVAREAMDRNVGIRNIFNPEHGFDPSALPANVRKLYDETKAQMDATAEHPPEGPYRGCEGPTPGWQQVDIPNELYEAVRELYPESKPPFRARPFDVQLIGGMVLAGGKIAEMRTGEGKTIVAPLACYLAACEHMQVHVVTVNDYLVQRDRDWVFPFFAHLGLTVGAIHPQHVQDESIKRQMYLCDVVYGTTAEFGFDYLRDNMKRSVSQQVQRKRQFAIVDEVDSILIDEARTPLIISGPAHDDQPRYELADELARHLVEQQRPWQQIEDEVTALKERIKGLEGDVRQVRDKGQVPEIQRQLDEAKKQLPELEAKRDQYTQYYEVKMERKACHLTHDGIAEAQKKAGVGSFYVDENMDIPHLLENSLRAHAVYERDRDYVVMDVPDRMTGKTEASVVIVDANTGRPMIGRQWSDGLHQSVEVKERVPVKQETQTVASITIQNYFKMYRRLAGMTGTADTEAQEFHDIYQLDVVSIPTNKPVIRVDSADMMYLRQKDKWESIVEEIKRFHDVGRPILVGTTSVEKSEMLSQMLTRKYGIKHEVLNAKQHEREANIVENAGDLGAVMIATNMAGRGTDIKLGPVSREALLEHWLKRGIAPRTLSVDASEDELREAIYRKIASQELDIKKREAEEMPFEELELKLLRHWAYEHTWLGEGKIDSMSREALLQELDDSNRVVRHRLRWFEGIEEMGGLHVIGTERHEARRIDNQLRGRSGRQGDKGSSRFFVSCEDELMKLFAGETMMKLLPRLGLKEGDAIESKMLSKRIEGAQRKVEERNFQIRKNLLEYDEVMEHQRQRFYGLRQRVLDGRDVKGLIFEFIEDTVSDACDEFLDPDYRALCAAEFAKSKLECSIMPDRLRGKDVDEMEVLIRREAKADASSMIGVTLGEYMPMEGSEVSVDFDSAGLVRWAKNRFGVELDSAELREGGADERKRVAEQLEIAAHEAIDRADLSGLSQFAAKDYGARQLAGWVTQKTGIELTAAELLKAEEDEHSSALAVILDRARDLYRKREIEYPVDFAMEMTMAAARQSPEAAIGQLTGWAKQRFGVELSADEIKMMPPAKVRERLLEESKKFVDEGRLEKAIDDALACKDLDELDKYLNDEYAVGVTEDMRLADQGDWDNLVRSRIENILRAELLYFERTLLLDMMDSIWKDHLYEMDQLRDAIGFRAVSQQDPRIAYKKEGSRLLQAMEQSIRDRITDYIFKARISPLAGAQRQQQQAPAQAPQPRQAPAPQSMPPAAAPILGSSISGPGLATAPPQAAPAKPQQTVESRGEASEDEGPDVAAQMEAAKKAREQDRGKSRKR